MDSARLQDLPGWTTINIGHRIVAKSFITENALFAPRVCRVTSDFSHVRLNPSLLASWDRSIPLEDKAQWRDPAVADAYVAAALASDPTSSTRTPPSFRAPLGALEDSFYLASGRQLWDASLILAPTLILRSGRDFWSRPEDAERLAAHLVHAPAARVVALPEATHFVHLDRPERGRERFLAEVLAFLADGVAGQD